MKMFKLRIYLNHKIILVPYKKITTTSGILHHNLLVKIKAVIDTKLSTKFRKDGVVATLFTKAHDLLSTTESGSEFLYHLLRTKHTKLASVYLVSVDIPIYSTTSCLYMYANTINNYVYVQSINNRTYTGKEISFKYLSHLDSEYYTYTKTRI